MNMTTEYDLYIIDGARAIQLQLDADRLAGSVEWQEAVRELKRRKLNTKQNRAVLFSRMLNRMK
jgi:hypothetical protein